MSTPFDEQDDAEPDRSGGDSGHAAFSPARANGIAMAQLGAGRVIPLATLAAPTSGLAPAVTRLETALSQAMGGLFDQHRAVVVLGGSDSGIVYLDHRQVQTFAAPPKVAEGPDVFLLSIDREALAQQLPMLPGLPPLSFRTNTGAGAFLLACARLLGTSPLDETIPQTRHRLKQHVAEILITTLLDSLDLEVSIAGRRRHRRKLIRRHIESRLHEPDLTPQNIAATYGISTRALYQLFDGESGAVSGWILNRRLERIHDDLRNPEHDAVPVGEIARRHGFRNAAHFSRRFRQKFGLSPREVRQRRDAR